MTPSETEMLSAKLYIQGDCKLLRAKGLSFSFHKEPMGGGSGDVLEPVEMMQGWKRPAPETVDNILLKIVCDFAN